MPPPKGPWLEMSTAKAWGYRWPEWRAESPRARAEMMWFEIESGLREAWEYEMNKPKTDAEKKTGGASFLGAYARKFGNHG